MKDHDTIVTTPPPARQPVTLAELLAVTEEMAALAERAAALAGPLAQGIERNRTRDRRCRLHRALGVSGANGHGERLVLTAPGLRPGVPPLRSLPRPGEPAGGGVAAEQPRARAGRQRARATSDHDEQTTSRRSR
jgi:hypothetical protein